MCMTRPVVWVLCAYVCMCLSTFVNIVVQGLVSGVFPNHSLSYFCIHNLSLNLKLSDLDKLAGQ